MTGKERFHQIILPTLQPFCTKNILSLSFFNQLTLIADLFVCHTKLSKPYIHARQAQCHPDSLFFNKSIFNHKSL